jgi:hypothetical protein
VDRSSVPNLPFTTIVQEASLGDHPTEPLYTIVARPNEWDELRGRLPDQAIEAGIRVGPSSGDLIVVAFAGVKGSSGHSITVENIDHDRDQVMVTVSQTAPGLDDIVEPAYTLPYHLVALSRKYLQPARSMRITFRDVQGNVLSQEDIPLY